MNEFANYHPIVNFIFFVSVIGFSMFFLNPVCLIISFLCAIFYLGGAMGLRKIRSVCIFLIPIILLTAILNPIFNHEGLTVLAYFPDYNPLTLESIVYGALSGLMLGSAVLWFSSFNEVMTSDKIIYLFGRIMPSMSLIISMTLRFVPHFAKQFKSVTTAQKCLGNDIEKGNVIHRTKAALRILSVMVTRALESSAESADSMKARGYGIGRRTAFSNYRLSSRDIYAMCCILFLDVYIIIGIILGTTDFTCFPSMELAHVTPYGISVYNAFFLLCILPVFIGIREEIKWKTLRSKI